jgi:hypothetical protein
MTSNNAMILDSASGSIRSHTVENPLCIGYGPVVRLTTELMNEWIPDILTRSYV